MNMIFVGHKSKGFQKKLKILVFETKGETAGERMHIKW